MNKIIISTKLSYFMWWPQRMFWHDNTLAYLRIFVSIWKASSKAALGDNNDNNEEFGSF